MVPELRWFDLMMTIARGQNCGGVRYVGVLPGCVCISRLVRWSTDFGCLGVRARIFFCFSGAAKPNFGEKSMSSKTPTLLVGPATSRLTILKLRKRLHRNSGTTWIYASCGVKIAAIWPAGINRRQCEISWIMTLTTHDKLWSILNPSLRNER